MLGAYSVGKTSLIQKFSESMFDDKYLTTVGVKITKKCIAMDDKNLTMMIWDLAGEDDYTTLKSSYLRGAAAYILVVDCTRKSTIETALTIHSRALKLLNGVPVILAFNKIDLDDKYALPKEQVKKLQRKFKFFETSAKTGEQVDEMFLSLAEMVHE